MKDSGEFPNSSYPHHDASNANQKQHYENLSNLHSKWGCQILKKNRLAINLAVETVPMMGCLKCSISNSFLERTIKHESQCFKNECFIKISSRPCIWAEFSQSPPIGQHDFPVAKSSHVQSVSNNSWPRYHVPTSLNEIMLVKSLENTTVAWHMVQIKEIAGLAIVIWNNKENPRLPNFPLYTSKHC